MDPRPVSYTHLDVYKRQALMGEQPNPWDLLQPQDETSRHRGAKHPRRCELLGGISPVSYTHLEEEACEAGGQSLIAHHRERDVR